MILESTLSEGRPRSLGRTDDVIEYVLSRPDALAELFECVDSKNEIVRMRASDALEKLCRQHPDWLAPYAERLLADVSKIRQPSVQWHLAQILSEISLNEKQTQAAIQILKHNLDTMDDWLVANFTIESLSHFARSGSMSRDEFIDILQRHARSRHKTVVSRCNKLLRGLGG